jgi:hypothetical protein
MVHGRVLNRGWLRYEFGVFNADGSNARTFDTERPRRVYSGGPPAQPFRSNKSPRDPPSVCRSHGRPAQGVSDLHRNRSMPPIVPASDQRPAAALPKRAGGPIAFHQVDEIWLTDDGSVRRGQRRSRAVCQMGDERGTWGDWRKS